MSVFFIRIKTLLYRTWLIALLLFMKDKEKGTITENGMEEEDVASIMGPKRFAEEEPLLF